MSEPAGILRAGGQIQQAGKLGAKASGATPLIEVGRDYVDPAVKKAKRLYARAKGNHLGTHYYEERTVSEERFAKAAAPPLEAKVIKKPQEVGALAAKAKKVDLGTGVAIAPRASTREAFELVAPKLLTLLDAVEAEDQLINGDSIQEEELARA